MSARTASIMQVASARTADRPPRSELFSRLATDVLCVSLFPIDVPNDIHWTGQAGDFRLLHFRGYSVRESAMYVRRRTQDEEASMS